MLEGKYTTTTIFTVRCESRYLHLVNFRAHDEKESCLNADKVSTVFVSSMARS